MRTNFMKGLFKSGKSGLTEVASSVIEELAIVCARSLPTSTALASLNGTDLKLSEIAGETGLLPAIVWHADRISKYGMDREFGIGANFTRDKSALLGYTVSLELAGVIETEALLFVMESFHQALSSLERDPRNNLTVSFNGLVAEFHSAMQSQDLAMTAARSESGPDRAAAIHQSI